jgi:ribonuclease HI
VHGVGTVRALVDTGCTQTVAARTLLKDVQKCGGVVVAVDGTSVQCSTGCIDVNVCGQQLKVNCLVLDNMLKEFALILGMDVVERLGGVNVWPNRKVTFGVAAAAVRPLSSAQESGDGLDNVKLDDVDFSAFFDGKKWTVKWKWLNGEPEMHGKVACYAMNENVRADFDKELQSWIDEGILQPVADDDTTRSLVPLMAVQQLNKGKVRPVLDFRALNQHVSSHSGASDICDETLRKWRQVGDNITLLDLRKAYLQLHVDSELWKHQVVKHKGKCYYLTRLGFGLNSAPKIMTSILSKVLSLDATVSAGTDNYVDDILVNKDVVNAGRVAEHLARYGLLTKPAESICGSKALGLQVDEDCGSLVWCRGNEIPEVGVNMTKRQLFSTCGLLLGHYPVASSLRVACGFVKRHSGGSRWEDDIGEQSRVMLQELVQDVKKNDPVGGKWAVTSLNTCKVWCDASSLAIGCALEINGDIVEDGAWMRKKDDGAHINMAELDSVVKGINMAVKWKVKQLEILTDSATVFGWLNSALYDSHKIRTRGMSEMLVKRRLFVVKELCREYNLQVIVKWVESAKNKADVLTRVSRQWLEIVRRNVHPENVCSVSIVQQVHNQHHLGIDRTLYLARLENPETSRREVADVVGACSKCLSIDPAPVTWEHGDLAVQENWYRVAIDVTHYNGRCYLTFVDCGPSRFAIWRKISGEDAASVIPEVEQIFMEHGWPIELLMDNGATFRSAMMRALLRKWQVHPVYRCAYRPSGNGIVERNHRTIKRMAARTCAEPVEMVYWYNSTPKNGVDPKSVPGNQLYSCKWKVVRSADTDSNDDVDIAGPDVAVGDRVFVKPSGARCTSTWPIGTVSGIQSTTNVEVDGVPRHIADIRPMAEPMVETDPDVAENMVVNENLVNDRPQRPRRPPERFGQNIYDMGT